MDGIAKNEMKHPVFRHSTYSWNIKCQKFASMAINGFIFRKLNENENIKRKKNPVSHLEVAC